LNQIICLSTKPWGNAPTRTQHLVSRIQDATVLYFSPAHSRFDRGYRRKGRQVRPGVTTYTLPPVLLPQGEERSLLFRYTQQKLGRYIAKTAARHRFHAPLLWCTCPDQVHLLNILDYDSLVYDCAQEWDDLNPLWEGGLAHSAELVFAASEGLRDRLSPCSNNIALLPNGVNFPLFSHTSAQDARRRTRPMLGWAGTIHEDLDLSPLLEAVHQKQQWDFLLLGAQSSRNPFLPKLRQYPNVICKGQCPLVEVPEYLAQCCVLMDFQRANQAGGDIVPSRIYEYLAMGKPIVSMHDPDQVDRFPDVIYAAHSSREFLTLCQHAMEESPHWIFERRRAVAQAASWANRGAEVNQILTTAGLL